MPVQLFRIRCKEMNPSIRLQNEIYKGNSKIDPSSMSTSRELSHCCYILENKFLGKKAPFMSFVKSTTYPKSLS